MFAIGIGSCGDEASGFDTAFALDGIETDEVEGEVLEDGEVMCGMLGTGPHLIIGEGDVHAPMQAILDRPVCTNGGEQSGSVCWQTTEVRAAFACRFALDAAIGLNDHERLEIWPLPGLGQTVGLFEGKAPAEFDPSVIFLDGLGQGVRGTFRRLQKPDKEVPDRISQEPLIVLDRQHVIGASVTNRLGDELACPSRRS